MIPQIPETTMDTIDNWVEHGLPTGGFLEKVIDNYGVADVLAHADNENQAALTQIVKYISSTLWRT